MSCPFVASIVARLASTPNDRLIAFSPGIITALLVGQVVGIRRKELGSFVWGPALGLIIGFIDLRAFMVLIDQTDLDIWTVSTIPFWGIGFGIWVACYRPSFRSSITTVLLIAMLDFTARIGWAYLSEWIDFSQTLTTWLFLVEPIVYVAPSVAAILLTVPKRIERSSHSA